MSHDFITLRLFRPADLARVDPHNSFVGRESTLEGYNSIYTFERDSDPIACAGLVQLWPGVAEAWTVLGEYAKAHPVWIVRTLRHHLTLQIKAMNLHRVQMHVEDDPFLLKWAKVLGFHLEGTMVKYTKEGKTLHVLAMLPE